MGKTLKEMGDECFKNFVDGHPELQFITNNQAHLTANAEKAGYAKAGVDHALKWYEDELALKKKVTLPNKLTFILKDKKYVQVIDDDDDVEEPEKIDKV